jgi:hypothetical protein
VKIAEGGGKGGHGGDGIYHKDTESAEFGSGRKKSTAEARNGKFF